MARAHTMTPARRAALRKAQLASARKRKGKHKKPIGSLGHAAAVVGTYVAAGNVGTYVGMRAHMSPGVAWAGGLAAGVGSAVAVHKKIKKVNRKRSAAMRRKTTGHGHSAQKGRRIA